MKSLTEILSKGTNICSKWNGINTLTAEDVFRVDRGPIPPSEPIPAKKLTYTRSYSRDFSAGRSRKLYRNAKGKFTWRKVPTHGIVFYKKRRTEVS